MKLLPVILAACVAAGALAQVPPTVKSVATPEVKQAAATFRKSLQQRNRALNELARQIDAIPAPLPARQSLRPVRAALVAATRAQTKASPTSLGGPELRALHRSIEAFQKTPVDPMTAPVRGAMAEVRDTQLKARNAKAAWAASLSKAIRDASGGKENVLVVGRPGTTALAARGADSPGMDVGMYAEGNYTPQLIDADGTYAILPTFDPAADTVTTYDATICPDPYSDVGCSSSLPSTMSVLLSAQSAVILPSGAASLEADPPEAVVVVDAPLLGAYEIAPEAGGPAGGPLAPTDPACLASAGHLALFSVAARCGADLETFRKTLAAAAKNACWARVYQHANYKGDSVLVNRASPTIANLKDKDLNDRVSSVRVNFAGCPGASVSLYEHAGYQNLLVKLTSSSAFVGDAKNDEASSVKLVLAK